MQFETITSTDLAYMAGIIDGEGTITALRNQNPKTGTYAVSLRLVLGNTSSDLMDWVISRFGGKLSLPRKTRRANHKPMIVWYCTSRDAVAICQLIKPYLIIKQRHAEILLALSELTYSTGNGHVGRYVPRNVRAAREPLLEEMRRLNYRGIPTKETARVATGARDEPHECADD